MKKKLNALRDIFVKLSRSYKDDFYLYDGEFVIQGEISFSRLPAVILVAFSEESSCILKDFLNITKGSLYHIESTDVIKEEIDAILLEYKEVLKLKEYDETELFVTVANRLSKVYQPMEYDKNMKEIQTMITSTYDIFFRKEYFSLDTGDDSYQEFIRDMFENKIYSELKDLNPYGGCPSVIVTASLFPLLTEKNIDAFEYSCNKAFDDGKDILYNITSKMELERFTMYVSYNYTDMSYTI